MRRKKLGLLVIFSLCIWVVVSYFLFFYCSECQKYDSVKLKEDNENEVRVVDLENHIDSAASDYKYLVKEMRKAFHNSLFVKKLKKNVENGDGLQSKINEENEEKLIQNKNDIKKKYGSRENVVNLSSNKILSKSISKTDQSSASALELHMRQISSAKLENGGPVIAVLVLSCNRVTVQRCLDQLLKWRPSKEQFPIIVSQDCSHQATTNVILSYGDQVTLIQQPDQSEISIPPKEKKFKGYFKIARHYGWALNQTFFNFKFDTAIIVEDDLDIAPDFFEYFLGTYWVLKTDPTLWCVSAWNDNGKSALVDKSQPQLLHRTDFFPGLGWMLTRALWTELSVKWPKAYWDDWIRKPEQRKDRSCIRPELPRTKTFGKVGVSNGMFFEKHLKYIKLNEQFVSFTKLNLSYLLKDIYDIAFVKDVYGSPVISYHELKNGQIVSEGSVRIPYYTKDQYVKTAKYMGLMDDFRSGVPRTAYRGVVTFSYKGRKVYLAPHTNWKGYDITWS